jgi:hypothetical protein
LFVNSAATTILSIIAPQNDEYVEEESTTEDEKCLSFLYFHIFMIMATAYCAMTLTGWSSIESDGSLFDMALGYDFGRSWRSVYIKLCFLALTVGLYVWSLVAPIVCQDRDFSM